MALHPDGPGAGARLRPSPDRTATQRTDPGAAGLAPARRPRITVSSALRVPSWSCRLPKTSRPRSPDRLHYRRPGPKENASAGRIHTRGACDRASSTALRSVRSPPRADPLRRSSPAHPCRGRPVAPRWMSPAGRTVWPASPPAPDTLDGGARGLCRPHLRYSAHGALPGAPRDGALRPVQKARERTPGEGGRPHRRAGPSRAGDGETPDDVPSLLDHTVGSCAEPPWCMCSTDRSEAATATFKAPARLRTRRRATCSGAF